MALLAHLYSRITGSQEDVATLSLQYIISSSPQLNAAFNKLMSSALVTEIEDDTTYSCQSVGENSERPDMSGVDSQGRETILCEMKFYAGLTSNQPNTYLDRLIKENGKALVFVCPEQRRVSLWNKLKELCKEAGRTLSSEEGYRAVVDGIAMAVVSWAEIIDVLRTKAASDSIEYMKADIEQLHGFCEMMDSTAFIPFSPEDMGPEVARKEERYYQVIDRVVDFLDANPKYETSFKGLRASANRSGYARGIRLNSYVVMLMYNRNAWINKTSAETPFWYYVVDNKWEQSEQVLNKTKCISEYERECIDNKVSISLYSPLYVQLDEIAADMMNQITRFIDSIEE